MENRKRILNLIGLATRAGKTVSGEFSTEKAVKSGKAFLVIVSEEASGNTRKLFTDKCSYYGVPVELYGTKEELGRAIGKDFRSSLGVCDAGLADLISRQLKERQTADGGGNGGKHGENKGT